MKFTNVQEVAEWRLCVGCGVCAYICPESKVKLVNVLESGIRPIVNVSGCNSCDDCLKACPGLGINHSQSADIANRIVELQSGWGPILEIWEGYASDSNIRYCGSSGGAATAIALYCMEREGIDGVLHTAAEKKNPLRNISAYSKTKAELVDASGSRYSPAAPCADLGLIESSRRPSVFIGKPCDIQGLRKSQELREGLRDKVSLAISIFCAGTPSILGTSELLRQMDIDPAAIASMRYRGKGWPGYFEVILKDGADTVKHVSYKESWGFMQKYRPYRCHLCPDGTGEFADISCGDPWYRQIREGEEGHSLIIVRTRRGREILLRAMRAGYLEANKADQNILERSQPNLYSKRAAVWGRLIAFKLLGLSAPKYDGFPLRNNWLSLPSYEKARSIFGTMRRIIQRRYWMPEKIHLNR